MEYLKRNIHTKFRRVLFLPGLKNKKQNQKYSAALWLHSAINLKPISKSKKMNKHENPSLFHRKISTFLTGPSFLTHLSCSYFEECRRRPKSSNFYLWKSIFCIYSLHRKSSEVTTLPLSISSLLSNFRWSFQTF